MVLPPLDARYMRTPTPDTAGSSGRVLLTSVRLVAQRSHHTLQEHLLPVNDEVELGPSTLIVKSFTS